MWVENLGTQASVHKRVAPTWAIDSLSTWSADNNLCLNPTKTKVMLFSTQQLARAHGLDEYSLKLTRGEVTQLIGFKANLKAYIGGI